MLLRWFTFQKMWTEAAWNEAAQTNLNTPCLCLVAWGHSHSGSFVWDFISKCVPLWFGPCSVQKGNTCWLKIPHSNPSCPFLRKVHLISGNLRSHARNQRQTVRLWCLQDVPAHATPPLTNSKLWKTEVLNHCRPLMLKTVGLDSLWMKKGPRG